MPQPAVEVREEKEEKVVQEEVEEGGMIPPQVRLREGTAADGWESDYATTDAPTRKAHYRGSFSSTGSARLVRVFVEEGDLDLTFPCEPDEYILDAAERAGHELPFSCRSGGCLSCSALLLSGHAEMGEQYVLEEEHMAEGFFLLCCSVPATDLVVRSHQEAAIS